MPLTDQLPQKRQLSPLAADIEAEFGHLRRVSPHGPRMSPAQAHALKLSIELAGDPVPKALRAGFHRNCLERLRSHFGMDYRRIAASQFSEAVSVISSYILETRLKIDKIAMEMPKINDGRWRVTFFDQTKGG